MKICRPDFYKEFQCIGSECTDTCCALWEIEVDEESADRYMSDDGPLAEEFQKYLVRNEDESYFRLTMDRRCPFLNKNNLCRMILTMGEDALCDICREHPRFYQWFGEYTEVGLGLCCEEAGRLLFSSREPLKFETEVLDEAEEEDVWILLLLESRRLVFACLQNRQVSLYRRAEWLLSFAEQAQPFLDEEDEDGFRNLIRQQQEITACMGKEKDRCPEIGPSQIRQLQKLLTMYRNLESLDGTWQKEMQKISDRLPELLERLSEFARAVTENGRETDFEHLMVYFVYRYYMESLFDSDLLSPVRFAVLSVLVIGLMDLERWNSEESFTVRDQILMAKWYSKEIEYCPDNMEKLSEIFGRNERWV